MGAFSVMRLTEFQDTCEQDRVKHKGRSRKPAPSILIAGWQRFAIMSRCSTASTKYWVLRTRVLVLSANKLVCGTGRRARLSQATSSVSSQSFPSGADLVKRAQLSLAEFIFS